MAEPAKPAVYAKKDDTAKVEAAPSPISLLWPAVRRCHHSFCQRRPKCTHRRGAWRLSLLHAAPLLLFSPRLSLPQYMCVFVDFMGLALTIPIQPFLADELDASPTQISMLVGVFSLGQLVGNMVMGQLSDKIGRKPIICASLICSTLSYIVCGFADTLTVLFIARGFCGICGVRSSQTMPVQCIA